MKEVGRNESGDDIDFRIEGKPMDDLVFIGPHEVAPAQQATNKRSTKSPWREFESVLIDYGYWQNMREHVARLRRRLRAVR